MRAFRLVQGQVWKIAKLSKVVLYQHFSDVPLMDLPRFPNRFCITRITGIVTKQTL